MHPTSALLRNARLAHFTTLGFALVCAALAPAQNALVLNRVAEINDTAPGTPDPWTALSNQFGAVGIDGGVAFTGTAGGVTGLWFGDPAALELAARQGQAAPVVPAADFDTFTQSVSALNVFGSGFVGRLSDATDSIWAVDAGPVLNLVAREGDAVPLPILATYSILTRAYFNNDGDLTYYATLSPTDGGGTRSLWRKLVADLEPSSIARSGESTGLGGALLGTEYLLVGDELSINDNATVVFHTRLDDGTVTAANDEVLLTLPVPTPASPTLIAREGTVPPGTAFPLGSFTSCHINDDDHVLFRAELGGAAPVEENNGVWFHDGALNLVAVEGDAVPGVAGAFFDTFEELFLANNAVIAIVAIARDTAGAGGNLIGRGIWVDDGGGLELVALVGQNALKKDGVAVHGQITAIHQVSMNMDGDLVVEMTAGGTKGVWVREVGATATRQLIVAGDKTYNTDRQVGTVTTVDLPEKEDFTAFGGGPFGRARAMGEDGVPLLRINSTIGNGLYFPSSEPLNAFITSTNEEAPGTGPGTLFGSIRPAGTLSENGLVAVRGYLQDGTGDAAQGVSIQGIWAEELVAGVPQLTLLARQGSSTPGLDTFGQFPVNPLVNANGSIAFSAQLATGGSVICAGLPGSLVELAKTGEATGLTGIAGGVVYATVRSLAAYNDNGRLAASCTFELNNTLGVTAGNDSAIIRLGTGKRIIAREGGSVGANAVGTFDNMLNRAVLINNSNRIAFIANRKRNVALGIAPNNSAGVWYHNGTTLTRVAVGGTSEDPQVAPETGGAQYLRPTDLLFDDDNRITFRTTLQGAGVTPGTNDVAIFRSTDGAAPVLVTRTGSTQLSGNGPGGVAAAATFASLARPDCDEDAMLVFRANLTVGTAGVTANDDEGIWSSTGAGATSLLLREGSSAPDANGNATADVFAAFDDPVVSLDGRVVVGATLRQGVGSIGADNDRAIFVQGSGGQFHRVVQKEQVLAIADGLGGTTNEEIVEVAYPASSGGAAGFYKAINSDGFVLTYLTFANGATASMVFLVP